MNDWNTHTQTQANYCIPCYACILKVNYHYIMQCILLDMYLIVLQFCSGEVLTSIMLHSSDLLTKDFPAINVLVPMFASALEKILLTRKIDF